MMGFVNKKKEPAAAPAPAPKGFELFGKKLKVDEKFLLIPVAILVLGLVAAIVVRSRRQAGSVASTATSTAQSVAQVPAQVAAATQKAVEPVVEKAREVFRYGQSGW